MGVLHLLSQPPGPVWEGLCPRLGDGDRVLLLGDGVYGLRHPLLGRLQDAGAGIAALAPDLVARGIEPSGAEGVRVIDYEEFVDLTVACGRILSW